MSSPELLQLIHLHLSYTHTHGTLQLSQSTVSRRWFHIKRRWCHIIRWVLVWRGHCLFFSSSDIRKSRGEEKHAHTSYFSYHLTMKEHAGGKLFTNHHDFTSVVAFMFVWGLADVLSGGCLLSAPISEDLWRELLPPQLLLRTHQEPAEDAQTQWGLKMCTESVFCLFVWWIGTSRCFLRMSSCLAGKQQMMQTVRDIPVIIRQNNTSNRNVLRIKCTSEFSVKLTYEWHFLLSRLLLLIFW